MTDSEWRKAKRADAKASRVALEAQWRDMLAVHEVAIEQWKMECETLSAAKVLKKDLPKRPTRPLKPKGAAAVAHLSSGGMESDSEGSEREGRSWCDSE
jgi:hypothetical protein